MQCNFRSFLVPHFVVQFSQNHNHTTPYFCGHICIVWCGLEFNQNYSQTALHFYDHMCGTMYKMRFETSIFFKFWVFLAHHKTDFFLCFGPSFKLLSQFFFILSWQLAFLIHTCQGYKTFFFFLKTRVIKLLIIYLILKINILIYKEGVVRCCLCNFLTIQPQIALHHSMWCTVTCGFCTVMPFCEQFWCDFYGLVNTPTQKCGEQLMSPFIQLKNKNGTLL